MHTFIVSSKNLERARGEVDKIVKSNKINKFDVETIEPEGAIGIEDVRNIQKKVFLKPFKGNKKAVVINVALGISDEAQNAMLKLLEEPPASTLIFLVTQTPHVFLPTVLSRAKVLDLDGGFTIANTNKDYSRLLKNLRIENAGEALKLAQDISVDKQNAIRWLEDAILAAREEMLKHSEDKQESLRFRKLIHKLELAHYDLKTTNVNPRLCLENLFLNLD